MTNVSQITTHVLDTGRGLPAVGVEVALELHLGGSWRPLATGVTDIDGRVKTLGPSHVEPGTYRLVYQTGTYFAATATDTFFPEVIVVFTLTGRGQHYHVPLLLSPFAYSTYRGS